MFFSHRKPRAYRREGAPHHGGLDLFVHEQEIYTGAQIVDGYLSRGTPLGGTSRVFVSAQTCITSSSRTINRGISGPPLPLYYVGLGLQSYMKTRGCHFVPLVSIFFVFARDISEVLTITSQTTADTNAKPPAEVRAFSFVCAMLERAAHGIALFIPRDLCASCLSCLLQ